MPVRPTEVAETNTVPEEVVLKYTETLEALGEILTLAVLDEHPGSLYIPAPPVPLTAMLVVPVVTGVLDPSWR